MDAKAVADHVPPRPRGSAEAIRPVDRFFSRSGPLASLKTGYSPRPEQMRFARAAAEVLSGTLGLGSGGAERPTGILLSDCPTGTGKSLGYLVPAVLSSPKSRIVVSTATVKLQHQLVEQDLPQLSEALKVFTRGRRSLSFALLKGRSNFLCENRFERVLASPELVAASPTPAKTPAGTAPVGRVNADLLEELDRWRRTSPTGDKEELDAPVPFWADVAADADDCAPQACPFAERCFYRAQRAGAEDAEVLVVNHALLLANVAADWQVFDMRGRTLILDEAHKVEEVMGDAFGASVTRHRVRYVTASVEKKAKNAHRFTERVEDAADRFFDELRTYTELGSVEGAPPSYDRLQDALLALRNVLKNDPAEEVNKLSGMVAKLHKDLRGFYEPPAETHAYDVLAPRKRGRPPELKSWLVDTGPVAAAQILAREAGARTVLTSATLAEGAGRKRSFSYVRKRLGVDLLPSEGETAHVVQEFSAGETFDYASNCLIYVERGIDPPGEAILREGDPAGGTNAAARAETERCVRRTEQLLGMSRGRGLVLLSTARAVAQFRRSLDTPYPTRFQGEASPTSLVDWLMKTDGGVLVATRGFWEGVDCPGDSVSLVVIDRVPFPVPDDPVIKRLCEWAGKKWFREVSLPKATVALRQGAGRLIRTKEDRGVIALLDPRVSGRSWGKAVLRSLPPAPTTSRPRDVGRFFRASR